MTISYVDESALTTAAGEQRLDLATSIRVLPDGAVESPVFFSGFVARPDLAAAGILAVADVAASRYADLGVAARLKNVDPVVTAGGERLRFEALSACNGVYARLDLLPEALGHCHVGFGTTNVDINPPLRRALATITKAEPLHLSVGHTGIKASSPSSTHTERKVKLPERWVRGLAEVPGLCQDMRLTADLSGTAVHGLLAKIPRTQPPGGNVHLRRGGRLWQILHSPEPGSIPLPGTARIRGAERITRWAQRLRIYVHDNGTTAWLFDLDGARFTLVLSPDPFRGFSGEGTLLTLLTRPDAEANGLRMLSHLGWSAVVDPEQLGQSAGLGAGEVQAGLAWLSACGRLGYDLAEDAWFHRELPVDAEQVLRRNPRLVSAQSLVDAGRVHGSGPTWVVDGDGGTYRVGSDGSCTCKWTLEHGASRGPCKHVLAVAISLRGSEN